MSSIAENKAVVAEIDAIGNGSGDLSRLDALCAADMINRNWSGSEDRATRCQAVSGSQGRPSASMVRAWKKWMPCLAAVAR